MSEQPLLSLDGDDSHGDEMYSKINERSELEQFRNQHTDDELQSFVNRFQGLWRPAFQENHERKYPLHPWKVLKSERERYAEEENSGDWPSMPKRHALRVVKEEYKEKWEKYSGSFNSSEQ